MHKQGKSSLVKRKDDSKRRKQSDRYQEQHHVRKVVLAARMGKEASKASAHHTGKLSTKDACQAESGRSRRGKIRACSNCHEPGHTMEECGEAHYEFPKTRESRMKKARHTVETMLLLFPKT